jgi:tRNA A37 threonylcarbamoyladenosine modification protein TsaB
MIELTKREVILSIETAVQGGSLSILENGGEIEGWRGTLEISKAEDVLEEIARLLRENDIARNQIKLIVISKDVGSLTGQKIGSALAKGLRKSLGCELIEISVMESLLLQVRENSKDEFVTAVANGKNYIYWQVFKKQNNSFNEMLTPQISTCDEFYKIMEKSYYRKIIFSSVSVRDNAHLAFILSNKEKIEFIVSKQSLANLIGLKAIESRPITNKHHRSVL